jgi:hypothetical protein
MENYMNLQEMMMALGHESDDGDGDASRLTPIQIVARLKNYIAARADVEGVTFAPGDVIVHVAPDVALTRDADMPVIFMGYLDDPIDTKMLANNPEEIHSFSAARTLDSTILTYRDDSAVPFLADSKDYKLHPDFIDA